eukprot:4082857-Pyramimonas_sp.AAC.1
MFFTGLGLTVKLLLSHLVTQEFNSPTDFLRTSNVRTAALKIHTVALKIHTAALKIHNAALKIHNSPTDFLRTSYVRVEP